MSENSFRDTAQHVGLSSLDCICGHTFALVNLVPVENEEPIERSFYACKTIHSLPGTFEMVRQSIIRHAHACIDSDGEYFEHLL